MKILVAANYFKGSLSAIEAGKAIKSGIKQADATAQVEVILIADGGDGTLEAVKTSEETLELITDIKNPLGVSIQAKWLMLCDEKVAIIEAAQANGLSLLKPEQYNPLLTTSYGVGELIKSALNRNCSKIYIGIGGSATNDAGVGMLQALGVKFFDDSKQQIGFGGGNLDKIIEIDTSGLDKRLKNTKIIVACDVNNPLCGDNGASVIYAPQKGASSDDVKLLDKNLTHFARLTEQKIGVDYSNEAGVGAAGGLGFALMAYLNAELISGFSFIADLTKIDEKIKQADFVITTEGRLDSQTFSGKAPHQIAKLANQYNKPVVIIAGSIEENLDIQSYGIKSAFSLLNELITLDYALKNTYKLLEAKTKQIFLTLKSLK